MVVLDHVVHRVAQISNHGAFLHHNHFHLHGIYARNNKHMGCHSKFRHDLPTNKTDAESQFFAKMEMNQHFGQKSATHFQVINF
jgi:hypothetical protein